MENLSDSDLGAGDLAPGAPQSAGDQDSAPTAQAMSVQALTIQRDPPTSPPPGGDPSAQTKPGSAGDVVKAVAAVPEVKQGVDQLKQKVMVDWAKLVANPIDLSITIAITSAIAVGAGAGAMSNPSSRNLVLNSIFNNAIPVPLPNAVGGTKLPGFSITILGSNGKVTGAGLGINIGQMLGWKAMSGTPGGDTAGGSQ
jgi:hypothetical protein